jgi:hypothetical protein
MPSSAERTANVDFEGAEVTVQVFFGEDTVEIAVEAPEDRHLWTSGASLS